MSQWHEFEEKWGKAAFKIAAKLVASEQVEEFIEDLESLPALFDKSNKTTLLVRDSNTAAKLVSRIPPGINILPTQYISAVEEISADKLNVGPLADYDGTCIFMYEDTPEAQVTKEYIMARFPNLCYKDIQYGVSAKKPADTDDYTLSKVLTNILLSQK